MEDWLKEKRTLSYRALFRKSVSYEMTNDNDSLYYEHIILQLTQNTARINNKYVSVRNATESLRTMQAWLLSKLEAHRPLGLRVINSYIDEEFLVKYSRWLSATEYDKQIVCFLKH